MSIFDAEVSYKKRIARGARSKVGGSKSRSCRMSTDGKTQKELAKMHGPVHVYRMVAGIPPEDLAKWPDDLKREYIKRFGGDLIDI